MDNCCDCLSLKKQLDDVKQKHLLDFRTIKQKIISTDTLIRSFQEKCQEFEKQKKYVVGLKSKLDGAQRSIEVIGLQLQKAWELKEPHHKECEELKQEKALHCSEIQALQDRVRGSENLVSQLQTVIKESEASKNSLILDATLHNEQLEQHKKRQQKNETQISKLSKQVLTWKNKNKALNKELTKSQSQVKTLLYEREESRKLISQLEKQPNSGNDHPVQQNDATLERQITTLKTEAEGYEKKIKELKEELQKAQQRNIDENKISVESKIKSPTTPRKSPRTRQIVTPKQKKEAVTVIKERIPITRLQQKNLVEEIQHSKRIPFSQQESLTSESESDAGQSLLDKVDELFGMPYCPSLSPLPPSQFGDDSTEDSMGSDGSGDHGIDNGHNDGPVDNISDGNEDTIEKDNHTNILQTENSKSRGKKRGNAETSRLQFDGTIMTLRSRKKRKSENTGINFELLSKETDKIELSESRPQVVRRTKSADTKEHLNSSDVNSPVTRSKSLEETTEGVLVVKRRRRRRKRRLSCNSDPDELFENSDLINVDNNVFESSKLPLNISSAENDVCKKKTPEGNLTVENGKKTKENDTFEEVTRRPRTRSMTKLDKQDVVSERVFVNEETSSAANICPLSNQTNSLAVIHCKNSVLESLKKSKAESKDKIREHVVVAEEDKNEDEKSVVGNVHVTERQNEIEILTPTDTLVRPQTRTTDELRKQDVVPEEENNNAEDSSAVKVSQTQNETNMETLASNHASSESKWNDDAENVNAAERNCRETAEVLKCLRDIIDNVVNAASVINTCGRISIIHASNDLVDTKSDADTKRTEQVVKECLNAVTDSIVESDNKSKSSIRYNSKGPEQRNISYSTSKFEAIDVSDNHVNGDISIDSISNKNIIITSMDNSGSKTTDEIELELTLNHKKGTTSDCFSTSDAIKETDENIRRSDFNKSSFVAREFKLLGHNLLAKNPETQHETDKELNLSPVSKESTGNVKSIQHVGTGFSDLTMIHKTTPSTLSPLHNSENDFEEHSEQISTPLSPIPVTPEKRGPSKETPSFDSLEYFSLSPIPPSPPCSIRSDELAKCISPDLTFDEILEKYSEQPLLRKKQTLNRNELPNDSLLRYPGVNEPQYTIFILTKLKNKEISFEQLITAFLIRRNIKNHTPICYGLIEVLKLTQDDEEHALMKKYSELYECEPECTNEPIVSEFESQMLVASYKLCNVQRFSSIMKKLVNCLGRNLSLLFYSGTNDAALLAMCRIYTGLCRLMGEGSCIRVMCYDILKQNKRHSITERIVLAVALVWPEVLGRSIQFLTIKPETVTVTGPTYHPFLATLQVILLSRKISCEQTRLCLQRQCGWNDIATNESTIECLARDLLRVLRVTSTTASEENPECGRNINNEAFEIIKCFELLSVIMGWKWTNDILIREILWPVLKEWKIQGMNLKQTTLESESQRTENRNENGNSFKIERVSADEVSVMPLDCQSDTIKFGLECRKEDKLDETSNETMCSDTTINATRKSDVKCNESMDASIANILRLLGVLACGGFQKEEMINVNAIINLMRAIVCSPDCEKVSFSVQVSAAFALLDMISFDPMNITQTLEDWRARCSIRNETLTAQFERRMTEVRTREWMM